MLTTNNDILFDDLTVIKSLQGTGQLGKALVTDNNDCTNNIHDCTNNLYPIIEDEKFDTSKGTRLTV